MIVELYIFQLVFPYFSTIGIHNTFNCTCNITVNTILVLVHVLVHVSYFILYGVGRTAYVYWIDDQSINACIIIVHCTVHTSRALCCSTKPLYIVPQTTNPTGGAMPPFPPPPPLVTALIYSIQHDMKSMLRPERTSRQSAGLESYKSEFESL